MIALVVTDIFRLVVAVPNARGVIRRKTGERQIVIVRRSTGLPGDGHFGFLKACFAARTGRYDVLHHVCQQIRRRCLNNRLRFAFFFEQRNAVVIQHLSVKNRFQVLAAVCNHTECSRQLKLRNTVSQTPQRQSRCLVREYASVNRFTVNKRRKSHIF